MSSSPRWLIVKDGNPAAMELFRRHYSYRKTRDQLKFWPTTSDLLFVGPGQKLVLLTPCGRALFAWRLEKFTLNGQTGVNCSIFRNEGAGLSSELIREADGIAWERWPGERLYTYVDPGQTRRKRDPGRCFLRADWKYCGWTKGGLRILEHCAVSAPQPKLHSPIGVEAPAVSALVVQSGYAPDYASDVDVQPLMP